MAREGLLGDLLIRAAQEEGYDSTGIFSCSVGDGFENVYHGVVCLSMLVEFVMLCCVWQLLNII